MSESNLSESIFTKIIQRQIPANIAFEDDNYIAIHDRDPQAPVHFLVIPKKPIATLNDVKPEEEKLVGGNVFARVPIDARDGAHRLSDMLQLRAAAQQTVFHIHLHVLAGRPFTWPPG